MARDHGDLRVVTLSGERGRVGSEDDELGLETDKAHDDLGLDIADEIGR
jgi:hypothetical protein